MGLFETFLNFLGISVEPQHRDKIPQLGLIAVHFDMTFWVMLWRFKVTFCFAFKWSIFLYSRVDIL